MLEALVALGGAAAAGCVYAADRCEHRGTPDQDEEGGYAAEQGGEEEGGYAAEQGGEGGYAADATADGGGGDGWVSAPNPNPSNPYPNPPNSNPDPISIPIPIPNPILNPNQVGVGTSAVGGAEPGLA